MSAATPLVIARLPHAERREMLDRAERVCDLLRAVCDDADDAGHVDLRTIQALDYARTIREALR